MAIVVLDDDIGLPCKKQQRVSVRACSWFVMTTTDGTLSVIIQISPSTDSSSPPFPFPANHAASSPQSP